VTSLDIVCGTAEDVETASVCNLACLLAEVIIVLSLGVGMLKMGFLEAQHFALLIHGHIHLSLHNLGVILLTGPTQI